MFLNNIHYTEIVRLLKQLHLLSRENKNESEEAEAIRDEMDSHWYKLAPQEMALIKIMSADLRMIEGKEVFRPVPPQERTRKWLGPRIAEARERQDWFTVLALLRNGPDFLTADQIAFLRGQYYTALGHPDFGSLFFEYAAQLKPDDYSIILMNHLTQSGQIIEAATVADKIIENANAHPHELIAAAQILCHSTEAMPEQDKRPVIEKVLSVLPVAIEQVASLPSEEQSDALRIGAYLTLGKIYDWLGQTAASLNIYNQLLNLDPNNAEGLTLRGILLWNSDRKLAEADFEQAINNNATTVIPCMFLAHTALSQGNYQKSLDLCQRALRLTQKPATLARILSWMAIAHAYLGTEPKAIERLFERATILDPLNEDILRNYDVFRMERDKTTHSSRLGWQTGLPLELIRQEEMPDRAYAVA